MVQTTQLSRPLLTLVLLMLVKVVLDYFAYHVSSVYGIYGLEVRGAWGSSQYLLSWGAALVVFVCALPYLSVSNDEVDYAILFLLIATFLPATSVYWVVEGSTDFLIFCATFWALLCLCLFFVAPWRGAPSEAMPTSRFEAPLTKLYAVLLALLLLNLLHSYSIGLDFSFTSVYERRREFVAWLSNGWTYPYGWSVYVFAVFLIFVARSRLLALFALGYVAVFFLSAGDKVYLFLLLLLLAFQWLRGGRHAVAQILFAFIALFFTAVLLDSLWLGFIVNRFVILPIDIAYRYAWHFAGQQLWYGYSFLSAFVSYPYDGAPSQIIGDIYYLRGDGANVNFLADGYVNLGWPALLPLLTFFVGLRAVFRRSRYLILLCPLLIQLMNAPLPTVMQTGGGILMVAASLLLSWRGGKVSAREKVLA